MATTWDDIMKAASDNRKNRHADEVSIVVSAYNKFLDDLRERVIQNNEVVAPSDVFSFTMDQNPLPETVDYFTERGFGFDKSKNIFSAYPSSARI